MQGSPEPAPADAGASREREADGPESSGNELQWHFLQCFGQPNAAENAPNADILSALEFDHTGEFLATGDRGGRVVLLRQTCATHAPRPDQTQNGSWMLPMEYNYLTEFQAHQPDFDYLKSIDIAEKVNSLSWLRGASGSRMLLSANDKQAKLWKVSERQAVQVSNYNIAGTAREGPSLRGAAPDGVPAIASALELKVPQVTGGAHAFESRCKREYSNSVHLYFINSVSASPDQATFLSADDLSVFLWNLERADASTPALDLRPVVDETSSEALQVITRAAFHPSDANCMAYSTSKRVLCLADLRQKDLHGAHAKVFHHEPLQGNSFYAELVLAASTFQFAATGTHVVTRDYMRACLWDVRAERRPLRCYQVHDHLWEHLGEVYESDSIFDRLGAAASPSGQHIAAGSYGELCVYSATSDTFTMLKSSGSPIAVNDQNHRQDPNTSNFQWKVENIAWHPSRPLVVATALNSLYTYCARHV